MKISLKYFSIHKLGLKGKFLLTYSFVMVCLLVLTGFVYYKTTSSILYEVIATDSVNLLKKDNMIIDQRLDLISGYSNGLLVDSDLMNYLDLYEQASTSYEIISLDRPISALLNKYFLYSGEIFSTHIITNRIDYGQVSGQTTLPNIIPAGNFKDTEIYKMAMEGKGKTVWIPTYDFFQMFSQEYIPSSDLSYQKNFSAAKLIKTFDGDYAILLINFLDTFFTSVFDHNLAYENSQYFIVTPEGHVVTHSDKTAIATTISMPWMPDAIKNKSGYQNIEIDGGRYIVCYDMSEVTGWISGIILDRNVLMQLYIRDLIENLLIILAILIVIPLIVIMFISIKILYPLNLLQQGMYESGRGHFHNQIAEKGSLEFRQLIRRFNEMNNQIKQLIHENYEVILLKKEAELNAYNLQLNPHFISNSLNIINLELIQKKEYELSDMVVELTQMMDYTLKTDPNLVPFRDDWNHTLNYIRIMHRRYKNKFDVQCHIQPEILEYSVPKFFLQPIIENTLVHGFSNISFKGLLKIEAIIKNGRRYFTIWDNGRGIDQEIIDNIFNDKNKTVGINNIRYRIKHVYGEQYEISIRSEAGKGTEIVIVLPACKHG